MSTEGPGNKTELIAYRRGGQPRPIHLTRREREVLSHAAQGLSSREIGDCLYMTHRTVGFHLQNIFEKLEVNNRVLAVRAAMSLGFIPQLAAVAA